MTRRTFLSRLAALPVVGWLFTPRPIFAELYSANPRVRRFVVGNSRTVFEAARHERLPERGSLLPIDPRFYAEQIDISAADKHNEWIVTIHYSGEWWHWKIG